MIIIKKIRSWSKPDGVPGLIGRKKVDWSIFNDGSHIPNGFHEDFDKANDDQHIGLSESKNIELIIDGITYNASLTNINRNNYKKDTLHIRYNKKVQNLLREKLSTSYNIIKEQRENSKNNSYEIPDNKAEYIEFYETGEPFKYKVKLITFDNKDQLNAFRIIKNITNYIKNKGFTYPEGRIENFYLSLKTKPFVLLAGISGTGKTKLIQLFAEAIGCNYKLISVRPDWSDSSDLLGYKNIKDEFQPGPIIDYIKKAQTDPDNIYFVCLDEMNLARVEYYFSDFLSIMETRRKTGKRVTTDKLMTEKDFEKDGADKYADLIIPDNLYLIGTVNMDETTHPFSKKVLDRANTIEFSEINLNDYRLNDDSEDVEANELDNKIYNDFLKSEFITLNDCSREHKAIIADTIDRLAMINIILKKANLQVGYRVRDEVCFYMIYNSQEKLLDVNIAFDFQLMQKILPRIQGSTKSIKNVLLGLFKLAAGRDLSKEDSPLVGGKAVNYVYDNEENLTYPRSAEKIAYMIQRFEEDGFTAYWL